MLPAQPLASACVTICFVHLRNCIAWVCCSAVAEVDAALTLHKQNHGITWNQPQYEQKCCMDGKDLA